MLKLNQQTVRNRINDGTLPAYHVGRRVRISRADLDRIIKHGSTRATAAATSGPLPAQRRAFGTGRSRCRRRPGISRSWRRPFESVSVRSQCGRQWVRCWRGRSWWAAGEVAAPRRSSSRRRRSRSQARLRRAPVARSPRPQRWRARAPLTRSRPHDTSVASIGRTRSGYPRLTDAISAARRPER